MAEQHNPVLQKMKTNPNTAAATNTKTEEIKLSTFRKLQTYRDL